MSKKQKRPEEDIDNLFNSGSNDETKNFFLDSIAKFCDRCGNAFQSNDISVVKRAPGQILLHVKCSNCDASHLASFLRQAGISSRTPFQTDLTIDELKHFSSLDAISSNEVLDVYDYINAQRDMRADMFLKLLSKAKAAQPLNSSDTK